MEKFEFQSARTGEVKPVARKSSKELETLKEALRQYRQEGTIKEWNVLREEAKDHFDEKTIRELDGSGFVTEWLAGK